MLGLSSGFTGVAEAPPGTSIGILLDLVVSSRSGNSVYATPVEALFLAQTGGNAGGGRLRVVRAWTGGECVRGGSQRTSLLHARGYVGQACLVLVCAWPRNACVGGEDFLAALTRAKPIVASGHLLELSLCTRPWHILVPDNLRPLGGAYACGWLVHNC